MADRYSKQLEAVEREMRGIFAKARAITTAAAEEGRSITEEEDVQLKGYLSEAEVLKEKRTEIKSALETRKRVEDAGASIMVDEDARSEGGKAEEFGAHRRAESIGGAFVKSDGYKSLMDRGIAGAWSTGSIEIEGKSLLSTTGSGGTAGGALIVPDYQPGILPKLFQRLTVADLMAQGNTASNLVRYMVETVATSGAAGVAEGAAKPESALTFGTVDEPVKKIATFLPVTEEMVEDVPQLESYINARLSLFVQIEEERQLLNGTGASNDLVGLANRIPSANKGMRKAGANMTDADHIFRAISRVREAFLEPDGIIMHPNDWEGIVLQKDTLNRYLGNGPWDNTQPTLWGLPVVVTQAVAEAVPIVGAFRTGAQVFRKGGLTVEASNSHQDYFALNKIAIRAEERLALAVYRPEAFATADLGTAGSAT